MSLILRQETASSIPTPDAGRGTIFLNPSDQLTIKDSAGNIATIPTFSATNNTSVFFNDSGALGESNNFTFVKTTNTLTVSNLTVTGTLSAGDISVSSISNGTSNVDIVGVSGNVTISVAGNANILTVTGTGANVSGTINASGNVSGNYFIGNGSQLTGIDATAIQNGTANVRTFLNGNVAVSASGNANVLLVTGSEVNVTGSLNTSGNVSVTGNAIVSGNLTVDGNITYVNVDTLIIEDPIIEMGGGPNGAPLTSNDGKDRGSLLHYYTSAPVDAFMGWDTSNSEFAFGSNVSVASDVVTFTTLGNIRASTFLGNASGTSGAFTGNVTAGNVYANAGTVGGSLLTGTLTTNAQPNVTSVGTLTSLAVTGNTTAGNVYANSGTVGANLLQPLADFLCLLY